MKPNFSYEEEAEEQFLNVSGQKALKQNSERFTQEVKEQGSWFCDFTEGTALAVLALVSQSPEQGLM